MAILITEECITCHACEPECPNSAISLGARSTRSTPTLCTECVGFNDTPMCAYVCPIDVCVDDPDRRETEEDLFTRALFGSTRTGVEVPRLVSATSHLRYPTGGATPMSDYDAIVIGAGHNGLTAAAVLQRGGLRTLCLEKNHYSGGMAATVELFPGYRFEIAGSVLFPLAPEIRADLGLDELPDDRHRRHVGQPGQARRRAAHLLPRRYAVHGPLDEKHGADCRDGHGQPAGLERGPGPGHGSLRRAPSQPGPSTRCTPVPRPKPSERPSATCSSARRWTSRSMLPGPGEAPDVAGHAGLPRC